MRKLPDIPPFTPAGEVLGWAAAMLRVPPPVTVSEAALRHRILHNPGGGFTGRYSFDIAPYLRRIHDCLTADSGHNAVAVMGPGQSGKSDVGNNWFLHTAIYDPADMIFLAPDKAVMRDYVVSQINQMIRTSPELHGLLLETPSADNIFSKQFRGCTWFFIWPVSSQMRARPIPRVRIDDYDEIPEDIDGQGTALMLLSARQTAFEGHDMTYVNSSPALGPKRGIEALVASGTDERWHVPCHHCGEYFVLDFERQLRFKRDGTPIEAKLSAAVVCPKCGSLMMQADKRKMMAAGVWAGTDQTVKADGTLAGPGRQTSVASFRIDGLMGLSSWGRLAELWRTADLAFEIRQDEADLVAYYNARIGTNYISRLAEAAAIEPSVLAARADDYKLGEVPEGVEVLTAAVDVQGNRFEVMVVGWKGGLESFIVDRFALTQVEMGGDRIDPARYPEHWALLLRYVLWRRYPVAGAADKSMAICNTAIDTGGQEGVSDNAVKFWYTARRAGIPDGTLTMVKGGAGLKAKLLPPPTYLELDSRGRPRRGGPKLYVVNVNQAKDIINARLARQTPGPGYIHFPADMPSEYLEEMTAEEKQKGRWVKIKPRNETLDLAAYNIAALVRHGGERADLGWVPAWARVSDTPASDVRAGGSPTKEITQAAHPAIVSVRNRRSRQRVRSSMMR